jgi:hypothetical protein
MTSLFKKIVHSLLPTYESKENTKPNGIFSPPIYRNTNESNGPTTPNGIFSPSIYRNTNESNGPTTPNGIYSPSIYRNANEFNGPSTPIGPFPKQTTITNELITRLTELKEISGSYTSLGKRIELLELWGAILEARSDWDIIKLEWEKSAAIILDQKDFDRFIQQYGA